MILIAQKYAIANENQTNFSNVIQRLLKSLLCSQLMLVVSLTPIESLMPVVS